MWNFAECRWQEHAIPKTKDYENWKNKVYGESPNNHGDDCDHTGSQKGDQNDARSIGFSKSSGLELLGLGFMRLCNKHAYIRIDGRHNYCSNHHDPIRQGDIDLPVE